MENLYVKTIPEHSCVEPCGYFRERTDFFLKYSLAAPRRDSRRSRKCKIYVRHTSGFLIVLKIRNRPRIRYSGFQLNSNIHISCSPFDVEYGE